MKRLLLTVGLGAAALMNGPLSRAQSTYWGFNYNSIFKTTSPSASVGTMPTHTVWGAPDNMNLCPHSIFDASGNLKFMVDIHGIFNASGVLDWAFLGSRDYLRSEIEVFPNGQACDNYYVSVVIYDYYGGGSRLELFNVDASNPSALVVTAMPDLISRYLGEIMFSSDPAHYVHTWNKQGQGIPIVTSPVKADGSRVLYCIGYNWDGYGPPPVAPLINPRFSVRSWRFAADGTYAELPEVNLVDQSGPNPNDRGAHMTIADISSDGTKIAYPGPYGLNVYNTTTGIVSHYPIPALNNGSDLDAGNITGIEWLPQYNRWYVSYVYLPAGASKAQGNMIYFNDGSTVINSVGLTLPPGTGASEIELGKDGRLYFAGCPTCSGPGALQFIIGANYIVSPGTAPSTTNPGILYSFDPANPSLGYGTHPVSVKGGIYEGLYYYLNNQIDGEDLSYWSGSSSSIVANAQINNGVSLTSPVTLCSAPYPWAPLQILNSSYLIMEFKDGAGNPVSLSPKEEYSISWQELTPCGYGSVPGSSLNYTDTWHSGSGPIDLRTYGSGALGSISNYGKYIGVEIKVRNKCNLDDMQSYKSLIYLDSNALKCDPNFTFEMTARSYYSPHLIGDIVPRAYHAGSSYLYNYDAFVSSPYPISKVYTPGSYTVCLTENNSDGSTCSKCIDICYADPIGATTPAAGDSYCNTNFSFKYSYASDGSPISNGSIFLDDPHPGSTYSYNWGDGTTTSMPVGKHYAPGTYTVCVSEYPAGTFGLPCATTCMDICIAAGGDIMSRITTEQTASTRVMTEDKVMISPNPTKDNADLRIELSKSETVKIIVTDMVGRQVSILQNGQLESGAHQFKIDTENFSAGIYQVQVITGTKVSTQKLSVVK